MQSPEKRKLCWNCEGGVSYDAVFCPYCGSDLKRSKSSFMENEKENHYKSLNDSLASLYRPPYLAREDHGYGVPDERDEELYEEDVGEETTYLKNQVSASDESETDGRYVWSLLFLSLGGNLLTLGLLILFFSEGGRLVLEWRSQFWFLYCLVSVPFFMIGWKCLRQQAPSTQSTPAPIKASDRY